MPTFCSNDKRIHFLGRYEIVDDNVFFDNVASGLEFEFTGSSLFLICKTISKPRINKNYPMFTILSVMIDNLNPLEVMVEIHNEDFLSVKIVDNLTIGKHHVTIMKTDDPLISTFVFQGLIADELNSLNFNNRLKLLVYGDSITAGGDNTIIAGPSLDVVPGTGIGSFTYATLFAFKMNMEISVFAQCGMPLANFTEDSNAINMMKIYKNISPQNEHEWNMQQYVPDVIMINLGTNDELGKYFDYDKFTDVYKDFIRSLNIIYKNKKYLLVCGQMNKSEKLIQSIFTVANDLKKEGFEIYAFMSKHARRGHPNVFEHKSLAEDLTKFVKDNNIL